MLRVGDQIGPYRLLQKIGRGNFGSVWLAERSTVIAKTRVALKIPHTEDVDMEAIKQEATVCVAASGHPNVLPIIEANIYDDTAVIASEYAPDGSLKDWLTKHGGAAPSSVAAVEMTLGILSGLQHLHFRRIVHRDLKPENILLQGDTPRLADFGLSRVMQSGSQSSIVAGSPQYMAPEAFKGKRNEQTDLWATGVILYQLVSGSLPFRGSDLPTAMAAILNDEPVALKNDVPEAIQNAVRVALQKETRDRYRSADQMRAALRAGLPFIRGVLPVPPPAAEDVGTTVVEVVCDLDSSQAITGEQPRGSERGTDAGVAKPPVSGGPVEPEHKTFVFHTVTLDDYGKLLNKRLGEGHQFFEELARGVVLETVQIPGGTFLMGAPATERDSYDDERPEHEITLSAFRIGKYPVTQAQWQLVAGWPKHARDMEGKPSHFTGDELPVDKVSWDDAVEFCARLAKRTGEAYRLPTEAEWEYACRAGTTTPFGFGETITPEFANYNGEYPYGKAAKGEYRGQTTPVGSLGVANAFGLSDMHGNVWEWCRDWYGPSKPGPLTNPAGPPKGEYRVLRGGSWVSLGSSCRSAYRGDFRPDGRSDDVGFRVVVVPRTP